MQALEAEKATLEAALASTPPEAPTLLHPAMGGVYKQAVLNLRQALTTQDGQAEAMNALRGLIDRIVVHPPSAGGTDVLIDLEGDLVGILTASMHSKKAAGLTPDDLLQIKLVAGTGFEPVTFRL